MLNFHESKEFLAILPFLEATVPACSTEVRSIAPVLADQIAMFGLPRRFADWYEPVAEVSIWPSVVGRRYVCDGQLKTINAACLIGTNSFGDIVVDVSSGIVVDLDRSSKESQLINTSFTAFLYFIRRMNQSYGSRCEDADSRFAEFTRVDPIPMVNNVGIWCLTTFEAEEGMY